MSEVKRDEIIFEEGWHESAPEVSEETPVDEAVQMADRQEEKADASASTIPGLSEAAARASKPLLLTIQLAVCLLAALVLFLLKAMDSDGYHGVMAFYHEEEQKPLISRDVFNAVDLSALFSQNAVTVEATPDETASAQD